MIVGNGDIAQALKEAGINRMSITFFARGVSNSSEQDNEMFMKEKSLLDRHREEIAHLVYFSSLSVYYADSAYVLHKKQMEQFVKNNFSCYTNNVYEVLLGTYIRPYNGVDVW